MTSSFGLPLPTRVRETRENLPHPSRILSLGLKKPHRVVIFSRSQPCQAFAAHEIILYKRLHTGSPTLCSPRRAICISDENQREWQQLGVIAQRFVELLSSSVRKHYAVPATKGHEILSNTQKMCKPPLEFSLSRCCRTAKKKVEENPLRC